MQVPAKVSYESFWFNYFYRIHLVDKTEAHRAEIMARVHSQGQLICWEDDDDEIAEERNDEMVIVNKSEERAMTNSSESFVCINEEEMENVSQPSSIDQHNEGLVINKKEEEEGLVINKKEEELFTTNKEQNVTECEKKDESDDDWEKWSDN